MFKMFATFFMFLTFFIFSINYKKTNYSCKKFSFKTYPRVAVHPLQTDGQTDGQTITRVIEAIDVKVFTFFKIFLLSFSRFKRF